MIELNVDDQCEVLFASDLQRTNAPTPDNVAEVIRRTVLRIGVAGCVARMAQEFGDHPEAAAERMRWVRRLVDQPLATHNQWRMPEPGGRPPAAAWQSVSRLAA